MIIFTINPRLLPVKIYNSFSIITTIKGRGTILIIISLLFLNDSHSLHKFCSIIFLIGGIFYYISEILVPTTKEELEIIENIFIYKNKRNNRSTLDKNVNNKTNIVLDNSNTDFHNIQSEINLNENLAKEREQGNNLNMIEDDNAGKEERKNYENDQKINNGNIVVEEHVEKKTDNPYDIPEDF